MHVCIYICIYIYIYICVHAIYLYVYILCPPIETLKFALYTCIYVYIYVYICIYIYKYVYTSAYIYTYTYMHIHMYTYVHMTENPNFALYIHIYVYIYIIFFQNLPRDKPHVPYGYTPMFPNGYTFVTIRVSEGTWVRPVLCTSLSSLTSLSRIPLIRFQFCWCLPPLYRVSSTLCASFSQIQP